MLAVFDISNTRVTAGLFEGTDLRCSFGLAADVRRTADEYAVLLGGFLRDLQLERACVHAAAIASVVPPLTLVFEQLCQRLFGVRACVVGAGTRTGLRIATRNPREVGPDRVVNAIAARHLLGAPSVVVDFDTATSIDVVAADGSYAGCIIAPGLALSAEALFHRASLLQRVELERPRQVVGTDTIGALQSGLFFGHAALVEGLLTRIRTEVGELGPVVATGELAALIATETPSIQRVEPALSLIGLRLFYELNQDGR